ncbi:DNA polymerase alpha subunit B [[Candida] anglica]|uniref:DNA polymerase alpha subunit B n=1 Tax=[Candida] anglica TaxID=148631 RepID=A0ABP0E7V1_9ASCO
MSANLKKLVSSFGAEVEKSPELISKLDSLLQIFNIEVDELFVHWETYNVTKAQEDLELSVSNLERLQEYIQESLARSGGSNSLDSAIKRKPKSLRPQQQQQHAPNLGSSPAPAPSSGGYNIPTTPSLKRRKVVEETPFRTPATRFDSSPAPTDYATANNTFQSPINGLSSPAPSSSAASSAPHTILETLNPSIADSNGYIQLEEDASTAIKPFKLAANFDPSKYKFRTMAMKLLESADVLDEQIDAVTQLVQNSPSSTSSTSAADFGNPCLSSQFTLTCCGRIVPDSPLYDSSQPLNSTALFLETSRFGGIGQRVPLDLSHIDSYSLFPGQIVCLRGKNPTGRAFIVEELVDIPELGAAVTPASELKEHQENLADSSLKLLITAGPYSNQHTLNYTKLEQLVDRINTKVTPHTVVMFGPFVDITNSAIVKGISDDPTIRTLDDVFKKYVVPIIKKINPRISVVMIPSLKDVSTKHCSFPQDTFPRKLYGLPKNVKVFPNPSSFFVNEMLIGCCNQDVFKDLKDVYKGGKTVLSNRFERIANHIFEQRRYYPSIPGSIKKKMVSDDPQLSNGLMGEELSSTDIGSSSLELPYMGLAELGDSLPDVLIVPSELKFFVKVIKGVVVINPGYFIRANREPTKEDGSYVVMNIKAPDINAENNVKSVGRDDLYYHNICERSRVDIYKN